MYKSTEKFLFHFSYPLCSCTKQTEIGILREDRSIHHFKYCSVASTSVPFSEAYDHSNLQMMQ